MEVCTSLVYGNTKSNLQPQVRN